MKLAISVAVLALVVVAVSASAPAPPTPAPAPAPTFCTGKDTKGKLFYKDPKSGKGWTGHVNCMKYHDCKDGKDTTHHCFWLIPLRVYDPTSRGCAWFWKADCNANDPPAKDY